MKNNLKIIQETIYLVYLSHDTGFFRGVVILEHTIVQFRVEFDIKRFKLRVLHVSG